MAHHSKGPFIGLEKIKKGLTSENLACAWLTNENYLCYWKMQDNDPIDIVAVHRVTGEVLKIDAKSVSIRRTGKVGTRINRVPTTYQKQLGVIILYVYPDGSCEFVNARN